MGEPAMEISFIYKNSENREIIGKLGATEIREQRAEKKGLRGTREFIFGGGGLTKV